MIDQTARMATAASAVARMSLAATVIVLVGLGSTTSVQAHPSAVGPAGKQGAINTLLREPGAVVDGFHAALARGDTKGAAALLADDALIFESGGVERSKAEYAGHHLGADAKFAQAVPRSVTSMSGTALGDMAWIATEARTTGSYGDRAIDSVSTETMVLRRAKDGWKIVHIHWSSAKAK